MKRLVAVAIFGMMACECGGGSGERSTASSYRSGSSCGSESVYVPPPRQPSSPRRSPPQVLNIEVRSWPPYGADDSIRIELANTERVTVEFGPHRLSRSLSLTSTPTWTETQILDVPVADIGEGLGTFQVTAHGARSWDWDRDTLSAHRVLIDLTPPELVLGSTTLRPDGQGPHGELELWVGDAFILGDVRLTAAGREKTIDFPEAFPATYGEAWDWSLVRIPATELPAGRHEAMVTATDAAGNATTKTFELVNDSDPPVVEIVSPAPQAILTGSFSVVVNTTGDLDPTVWVSVLVGGAEVGEVVGPTGTLDLEAGDFPAGPTVIEALARDRAGNTATASVAVELH